MDRDRSPIQNRHSGPVAPPGVTTSRMVHTAASTEGLRIELDPALVLPPVPAATNQGMTHRLSLAGGLATPYFTRIVVPDSIDAVAQNYLSWAMGLGEHERLRQRRILQGVNPKWEVGGNLGGADLVGGSGLSISIRAAKGVWAFRFVHPEEGTRSNKPTWWTVVRVTPVKQGGCQIEHQVLRQTATPEPMPPITVVPTIIRDYLDRHPSQGGVRMQRFAQRVRGDAAEPWVRDVLLGSARGVPAVLITQPREITDGPCADSDLLAKNLQGMATVVLLEDKKAAWVMQNALADEGFDSAWGAYNGAIRVYSPGITLHDSPLNHRLWISNHLLNKTPEQRMDMITSEVVQRQTASMPGRFVMALDDVERAIREEAAEQARQQVAEHARAAVSKIEVQKDQITVLETEVDNLKGQLEYSNRLLEFGDTEIATLKAEKDDLSRRLYEESTTAAAMRQQASGASAAARARAVRPSAEVLEAVDAALTGKPTLVQALTFLEWRYPDRVRVHEDAYESARDATSVHFRHEERAFELLKKLVAEFHDILSTDGVGGDAYARRVFGNNVYAARESETASSSARARAQRERVFDGKTYPMWRHLRIGSSSTATDGWRCHFDWDADNKQILIGHCGVHLDHK